MSRKMKTSLIIALFSTGVLANAAGLNTLFSANVGSAVASQVIFSPYKDVGTSMNWWDDKGVNTYVMSTMVNKTSLTPLAQAVPAEVKTVTWAFATGECGNENWAGIKHKDFALPNVNSFVKANKNYILSTGGAAGVFTCSSNAGMKTFIDRYSSKNLIGLDMDIEGHNMTEAQINSLIDTLVYAQKNYPNLRISFTLATLADSSSSHVSLNSEGQYVVNTAKTKGLNFFVNLMAMDYGNAASDSICVVNPNTKECDMGLSAIQAAENLHSGYNIPYNRIEITPLIGDADVPNEVFTINDANVVAKYVKDNGLAGYHYWSYDRDTPCTSANKQGDQFTICNLAPGVKTLSYTNAAIKYFQ